MPYCHTLLAISKKLLIVTNPNIMIRMSPRFNGNHSLGYPSANPIIVAGLNLALSYEVSRGLNRGFRIIQHHPIGNDLEITAWLKKYEPEYTDLPTDELVINLSLSQESADLAGKLLSKWMNPETTADEMQSFINKKVGTA